MDKFFIKFFFIKLVLSYQDNLIQVNSYVFDYCQIIQKMVFFTFFVDFFIFLAI